MSRSDINQIPRLKKKYIEEIVPALQKTLGYSNVMQVPKLDKIVINRGVGMGAKDFKLLEAAQNEIGVITGQKPVITKAKKSVSNFKIREGDPVGCKVTLRTNRMYEFLDRLINVALPRIKDFRGLSLKSFDANGNYTFGLKEQIVFPEIDYDKVTTVNGMDITLCVKAKSKDDSKELLKAFGVPFSKK